MSPVDEIYGKKSQTHTVSSSSFNYISFFVGIGKARERTRMVEQKSDWYFLHYRVAWYIFAITFRETNDDDDDGGGDEARRTVV